MDVRKAILNDLYRNEGSIRQEIMKRLRMRLNNVVAACDQLLEEGCIRKEDSLRQRSVRLELVPERFLTIGAEHLPDRLVMVLMDCTRREWERREYVLAPDCGGKERLELIVSKLSAFREEYGKANRRIVAVGLADVGILDPATGRSIFAAHVKDWDGQEVRAALQKQFGCHTEVLSRSDAGCYADIFNGGRHTVDNLIYIIVKGGIGASLVLHGNFLREYLPASGEMHVRVRRDGPVCSCGKRGCLETVSSADGILAGYLRLAPKKGSKGIRIRDVVRKAVEGDPLCVRLLEEGGDALGRTAADISGFAGISRIVLRSEVNDEKNIYTGAFSRALKEEMLSPLGASLQLSVGGITESDAPSGAALYSLGKFFQAEKTV